MGTRAMTTAIEDQLLEARTQVDDLTRDYQAQTELLNEASANVDSLRGEVELLSTQLDTLTGERDSANEQVTTLQTRITELQASQADFDRKLQLEVARVVASTGTTLPARITPAGDHQQAPQANSLQELVAQYDRLVTAKQPEEAAAFYQQHLAKHFTR
jgi:chromosome segregation ATPase